MNIVIDDTAYHRNGISGAPFHALLFRDPDEGRMLGIVFDAGHHVAVFNLDKLALGNIAFGVNSWRGDRYEPALRAAIPRPHSEADPDPGVDVHRLLAGRREIAVVWTIEDVRQVRPDLTDDQCWAVLQKVEKCHDANHGIAWDTLDSAADLLFGHAPTTEAEDAHG